MDSRMQGLYAQLQDYKSQFAEALKATSVDNTADSLKLQEHLSQANAELAAKNDALRLVANQACLQCT